MTDSIKTSPEAAALLPPKKAFENNVLPLKIDGSYFYIGIPNKNDYHLISDIGFFTGLKIRAVEVPADIIFDKLKSIYGNTDIKNNGSNEINSDSIINENSNVEFVNQIITAAIKSAASDIHLETFENMFRVRYRIDGCLREVLSLPKERSLPAASRLKIMADLDISEKRRPQDGKIRFNYQNSSIDIRISTLPTSFGEKVVLRILNRSQVQLNLEKLGFDESQFRIFNKNIRLPYGMILVTGPTGSGKTTTLYAALQHIHTVEKNIITIEDPVEYNLEGINQSSVKPEIGYDFASALRSFLRQDPDIIMVGEIRDKETAEIAIRASLTGHLVFSTLHTNDSVSAVTRLIDMGVEPFLVASSVRLIIAQRLVRTLCICTKSDSTNGITISSEKGGCEKCSFTGFKGRQGIFEMLEINEELSELISKNAPLSEIKKKARGAGFLSLKDSGIRKINLGLTTYEEVLRETML